MRQHALIGALFVAGSQAQAAPVALGEDELKAAVVGKTVKIDTPLGIPVTVQISANGLMHGTAAAPLSLYLGSAKDRGRWRIKDGKLCQKWFKWLDAEESCLAIKQDGLKFYWRKDDGKIGTATIEPGPPMLAGSSASGLGLPPAPEDPMPAPPVADVLSPAPEAVAVPRNVAMVTEAPRPPPLRRPTLASAAVASIASPPNTREAIAEPQLVELPRAAPRHPAANVSLAALNLPHAPIEARETREAEALPIDPFDGAAQPMRWAADLATLAALEHRWCLPDAFSRGPSPPREDVALPPTAAIELEAAPSLVSIAFEQVYPGELPLHEAACLTASPALLHVPPASVALR